MVSQTPLPPPNHRTPKKSCQGPNISSIAEAAVEDTQPARRVRHVWPRVIEAGFFCRQRGGHCLCHDERDIGIPLDYRCGCSGNCSHVIRALRSSKLRKFGDRHRGDDKTEKSGEEDSSAHAAIWLAICLINGWEWFTWSKCCLCV